MLLHQLLFFFSALGVFNGLLLVIYQLLIRNPRSSQGTILGFLGLAFCVRVGVSCFYYFSLTFPWLFVQLGLMAQLLIGPLVFAFTVHGLVKMQHLRKLSLYGLYGVTIIGGIGSSLYTFEAHPDVWDYPIRYAIHASVCLFLLAAAILLYPSFERLWRRQKVSSSEEFTLFVYCTVLLLCAGFVVSLYVDYVLGPIISSILFYLAVIFYWWRQKKTKTTVKYAHNKIVASEAEILLQQLERLMEEKKTFKNPALTIGDLAIELNLPKARLSQLLNDNYGQSFSAFINRYRVQEAQLLLKKKELYTVEAIGYEVGFGSRSSFFATFKQFTGLTPKKFQDEGIK